MNRLVVVALLAMLGACAVTAPGLRTPVQGEIVSRDDHACYVLELHRGGAVSQHRVACPP